MLAYLEFVGARLVFLIDWNRARKALRGFLPGPARVAVLRWAAAQEVGHRGFLELGGARLINQAIEAARAGRCISATGCATCWASGGRELVRFALRAASEGLRARQSQALIRDRMRAELARHFANEERRLLRVAAEHAGLVFEWPPWCATAVLARGGRGGGRSPGAGRGASSMTPTGGDQVREAVRRRPDHGRFCAAARGRR